MQGSSSMVIASTRLPQLPFFDHFLPFFAKYTLNLNECSEGHMASCLEGHFLSVLVVFRIYKEHH